ncbi:MAG: ferrochelatase, partial [Dissulfurimicrobium sp.]
AWWIAKKRAPKSEKSYGLIGGKSPLLEITMSQARAVERLLNDKGIDITAAAGMRYWSPRTPDVLKSLKEQGISSVAGLSLYPHYSRATSGSSLADFSAACEDLGLLHIEIMAFPDYRPYIEALAECLEDGLDALFRPEEKALLPHLPSDFALLYSAHSLPEYLIESGDPYVDNLRLTIEALEGMTGVRGELSFQSRSGPVKWLGPGTDTMILRFAKEGKKRILVVPISFVSDHVETLYEIDMLYKDMAAEMGVRLVRAPSLNDRPAFIAALGMLVEDSFREIGWLG